NDESDTWDDSVLIKAYDDAVSAMKARLAEQHPEFSPKPANKPKKKKRNKAKQKKKSKNNGDSVPKWSAGDLCQAIYTEDGEIYEAKILSIDEHHQTCVVQYTDYGNEEEQELADLMPLTVPPSSQDQLTDTASEAESVVNKPCVQESSPSRQKNKNSSSQRSQKQHQQHSWPLFGGPPYPPSAFGHMPPPPPPPPSFPPFQVPGYQASGPSMPLPPMFPSIPPPPPWFSDKGAGDENEALYSMLISWYMSGYHTGYYQGLKHATAGHGAQR
ncbi:survival motor neuron protein, partial [Plakobranchus ocellatus]